MVSPYKKLNNRCADWLFSFFLVQELMWLIIRRMSLCCKWSKDVPLGRTRRMNSWVTSHPPFWSERCGSQQKTLLRISPNLVHSMDTGSVNSLPLSVRIIGNKRQYCSCPRVSYSHSKTSVTDRAEFRSLKNANMRFELRKNTVSSTLATAITQIYFIYICLFKSL